ncbi:hypothetical protein XENORESO_000043 [Xenotaenia resolanae]|uniref:Uncharacterized protein n=1 Tax=Xenotaenia resolanae TaxID=208358 RepID=A0ABV0WJ37_9TELE
MLPSLVSFFSVPPLKTQAPPWPSWRIWPGTAAARVEPHSLSSPSCPPQLSAGEITEDVQQQLPMKRHISDAPARHQAASLGVKPPAEAGFQLFRSEPPWVTFAQILSRVIGVLAWLVSMNTTG